MYGSVRHLGQKRNITRCYTTPAVHVVNKRILRDFIGEHLFSTGGSYFATQAPVHASNELKFNDMWGEGDYRVCKVLDSSHNRMH
jgi:hypothetical protein